VANGSHAVGHIPPAQTKTFTVSRIPLVVQQPSDLDSLSFKPNRSLNNMELFALFILVVYALVGDALHNRRQEQINKQESELDDTNTQE
jgi:hypothetical protein